VLLLIALPLGQRAGRSSAARVIGSSLSVMAAIYLALVTCEAIWRRHETAERQHRIDGRDEMDDPVLGWKWRPSSTATVEVGGRTVTYAFNSLGNRAPRTDVNPDLDRPTLLIAGESFSFGFGLEWDETFGALLAQRLGMQVENLSCNGYGNDQAYLRLMDQLPRFTQPRAVVTFVMLGQIKRNVLDTRPRLQLADDGSLEMRAPRSWLAALLSLDVARARYAPIHSDEAIPLTRAILRETARHARERGAYPLFIIPSFGPPRPLSEHAEAWLIKTFFEDQHLDYVLVDLDPTWSIPDNGHPDARANQAFAEVISGALRKAGLAAP
jgi:hypothetical protein